MRNNRLILLLMVVILVTVTTVGVVSAQDTTNADCPSDSMMDVSTYNQTQAYPAPEISVRCENDLMIVQSNGIPNFEFVAITPNALSAQNYTWSIPLNPEIAEEPTGVPLTGISAFAVNGLPIFGPTEAPNDGYADPFLDQILDYCNGHTAQRGDYHYHARPECLFEDMEGNVSLVLAWSLDGFPILAPYACANDDCSEVIEVQSSYQRTQDVRNAWEAHEYIAGSGDLDACNGMTLPDGSYAYYATDTFPYFMGCYVGTPLFDGNTNAGQLAPVANDANYIWDDTTTTGGQGGDGQTPPPNGDGGQGGNNNGQTPPPNGDGGQGGNNGQPPPPNGGGGQGGNNGQPPPPGGNGG